jgi:putative PIN family toxin of toxin-antitoxin system
VKAVLDTNILISGVFFAGTPGKVLEAWRAGRFAMVLSPLIIEDYHRVAAEIAGDFAGLDIKPILDLITLHAEVVEDRPLPAPVCRDAHDGKFLACSAAVSAVLVSGDKDLLAADGALGVRVLTPRAFMGLLGG